MTDTTFRYIVKSLKDTKGKSVIGVYDRKHGSYPGAGPALRAIGIEHLDWMNDEEQAKQVADLLNGLPVGEVGAYDGVTLREGGPLATLATPVKAPRKGKGSKAKAEDDDFRESAMALVADQKGK